MKSFNIALAARALGSASGSLCHSTERTFAYLQEAFEDPKGLALFDAKPIADIPQYARDFLASQETSCNFYSSIRGEKTLLEILSLKAKEQRIAHQEKENIVITAGAVNAFAAVCAALCDSGDIILAFSPTYILFANIVRSFGAELVLIPSKRGAKFAVDPEEVSATIRRYTDSGRRVKAVLVVNPTNIDAQCYAKYEVDALSDVLAAYDIPVIEDRVYDGLQLEQQTEANSHFFSSRSDLVTITIDSMSKRYGATQWRIGWIFAPEEIASAARSFVMQSVWSPNESYQRASALILCSELAPSTLASGSALGIEETFVQLSQSLSATHATYMQSQIRDYKLRRDLTRLIILGTDRYQETIEPGCETVQQLLSAFADQIKKYPSIINGIPCFSCPVLPRAGMFLLIKADDRIFELLPHWCRERDLVFTRMLWSETGVGMLPPSELTLPEGENCFRIEYGVSLDVLLESLLRVREFIVRWLSISPESREQLVRKSLRRGNFWIQDPPPQLERSSTADNESTATSSRLS